MFHSPVWTPILTFHGTKVDMSSSLTTCKYFISHAISSGHTYGVFDDEYQFKNPESKALGQKNGFPEGGHLWWESTEEGVDEAVAKRLEDQMDFPLVSVACSYDAFDPLDYSQMTDFFAALPLFPVMYGVLDANDTRDPETWKPTAHGQVLFRNSTSTKSGYGKEGITSALARWLVREKKAEGFRGIQIECLHSAVTSIWERIGSEVGGKSAVVSELDTGTFRDEEGKLLFEPSKQRITKIWVDMAA